MDAVQKPLFKGNQALHQTQSIPVQLPHLSHQGPGNAGLVSAFQRRQPGSQLPVNGNAGELLGLALRQVCELRDQLPGHQHTAANNAVAQRRRPGKQRLKPPQKALGLRR